MDSKTLIFKFHKPASPKVLLLVESGVRVHATEYDREGSVKQPSHLCARLRHFLRERRCTAMGQWGFDRIMWLEFGHDRDPSQALTLIFELYSSGNVILLDHQRQVLLLMRTVKMEGHLLAVGSTFEWPAVSELPKLVQDFSLPLSKTALKTALPSLPPVLIDELHRRQATCTSLNALYAELCAEMEGTGGYCDDQTYGPFPLENAILYATLSQAVDAFYWRLEQHRLALRTEQQAKEAERKREAIEREQQGRLAGLQTAVLLSQRSARLIEEHLSQVEAACTVIKVGLEHGLNWDELDRLVAEEKAKGRAIAQLIKRLRLSKGAIELELEPEGEAVEVLVHLGGHANAQRHWEAARLAQAKLERTEAAYQQAMVSAAARIKADLADDQRKRAQQQRLASQQKRKVFWFERFNWFISSDDYLVLSGRDAQQNEILVKRYLKPGDGYVHADMAGAASVIIKNRRAQAGKVSIPPRTLAEAGNMALVCSRAWEAKIVTSAWWVWGDQVSKTAPSGEYLATGSFMIRGRKNFLPPSQLTYGFGIMFTLDPEAREKRKAAREEREQQLGLDALTILEDDQADKYLSMIETSEPVTEEPSEKYSEVNAPAVKPQEKEKLKSVDEKKGTRGKKGKAKKIAKKYADQDEEEREARMALLASAGAPKQAAKQTTKPTKQAPKPKKELAKKPEVFVADDQYDVDTEETRGEDELAVIDAMTGTPSQEEREHLLHALPMCAPITALQRCLLRVKLAPGTIKRGKAAQQALHLMLGEVKGDAPLLTMVKAIPEMDLTQTMIGKVRLVTGQQALEKAIKQTKRK